MPSIKQILIITLSLLILNGCEKPRQQIHLSGPTMGTTYNVKYIDPQTLDLASTSNKTDATTLPATELQNNIDALLKKVNAQMSTYQKDSELSRFNQYKGVAPFSVSYETATVVNEAIRLNQLTHGALDVTVGPLVNLWGFGPEARRDVVPNDDELTARRANVGIHFLTVNLSNDSSSLTKSNPNLYVDLSTIAKGWGVDVVANYIESLGINNYMVEIGGEIRLKGRNKDNMSWRIAIEKPSVDERAVQEVIEPGDMAVATSGDYRNYFERDGIRYSHIINPQTGRPIDHKVVSVTVLDRSCMTADGLATGLMVLGEIDGINVANQHNIPVLMIVKTDNGFKEVTSEAFKPFLTKKIQ